MVNRGYVPLDHTAQSQPGRVELTGYLRWPEPKSMFVSSSDANGETWFVRDQRAMAAARGWGEVAPFYIDQEAPVPEGGLPRPARLQVTLRNDHLGYALTWFGLAAVLAVVFAAWLFSRRRQGRPGSRIAAVSKRLSHDLKWRRAGADWHWKYRSITIT